MFHPTSLNSLIKGLQEDATKLREHKRRIAVDVQAVTWSGPRADRYRAHMQHRLVGYDRHADRLDAIADRVRQLQHEVEVELAYLKAIEREFHEFVNRAKHALGSVLDAAHSVEQSAEHMISGAAAAVSSVADAVTGDLDGAREDLHRAQAQVHEATQELASIAHLHAKHAHLPKGDPRWRDADADARRHPGAAGITYSAPSR